MSVDLEQTITLDLAKLKPIIDNTVLGAEWVEQIRMSVNWIMLIIGGLFETGFAISLGKAQYATGKYMWLWLSVCTLRKHQHVPAVSCHGGWKKPSPLALPMPFWGAIGAIGTVIAGVLLFKEPVTFWRMFFLSSLILSVVGLQLTSTNSH